MKKITSQQLFTINYIFSRTRQIKVSLRKMRNIRATQSLQKNTHHLILKGCTTVFIPFIFLPSTAFSAARIRLSLTATKE